MHYAFDNLKLIISFKIETAKSILDGFPLSEQYLMVSVGYLNNKDDLIHSYASNIPFSNTTELLAQLNRDLNEIELEGEGSVNLGDLELLNRNEFFAKRYGSRSTVPKISIIFRGDDDYKSNEGGMRNINPIFDIYGDLRFVNTFLDSVFNVVLVIKQSKLKTTSNHLLSLE